MLSSVLDQTELLVEGAAVISVSASVGGCGCGGSGWINACTCVQETWIIFPRLHIVKWKCHLSKI